MRMRPTGLHPWRRPMALIALARRVRRVHIIPGADATQPAASSSVRRLLVGNNTVMRTTAAVAAVPNASKRVRVVMTAAAAAAAVRRGVELGLVVGVVAVHAAAAAQRGVGFFVAGRGGEGCFVGVEVVGVGAVVLVVDGVVARQDAVGVEVLERGPGDEGAGGPEESVARNTSVLWGVGRGGSWGANVAESMYATATVRTYVSKTPSPTIALLTPHAVPQLSAEL